VCRFEDREFSRIYAVTERAEDAWAAICRYKYDEDRRWAEVLARLVVGYLDDHRDEMSRFDLITTGALYVGPRANRLWDHLRLIQDAARRHGPQWPFADDLIVKSAPSGRFLGIGVQDRQRIAEGELRSVLSVPHPERVAGRRVLVLDDVGDPRDQRRDGLDQVAVPLLHQQPADGQDHALVGPQAEGRSGLLAAEGGGPRPDAVEHGGEALGGHPGPLVGAALALRDGDQPVDALQGVQQRRPVLEAAHQPGQVQRLHDRRHAGPAGRAHAVEVLAAGADMGVEHVGVQSARDPLDLTAEVRRAGVRQFDGAGSGG
jgi:hypothetical protein